ncbi:hypothetical protein PO909_014275 [Leuciscus waleckii]
MPSQQLLHVSMKFVLVQFPCVLQKVMETLKSPFVDNCNRVLKEKRVLNHTTDVCLTGVVCKVMQDSHLVCVPPLDLQHDLTLLKKQERDLWLCGVLKVTLGLTACAIFLYMLRGKPRRRVRKFRHIQELFRIIQSVREDINEDMN